jgi:hypothetical protein
VGYLSSTLMSYPITSSICLNKGKFTETPADTSDIVDYQTNH